MNPSLGIERQREVTLVDWVFVSGGLLLLACMCLCIVFLGKGASHLAATQTQALLRDSPKAAPADSGTQSNQVLGAQSVTAVTLAETPSLPARSSSKVLSTQAQRSLDRKDRKELAGRNATVHRVIFSKARKLAAKRVEIRRRAVDRRIPTNLRRLIAMGRRTSRTKKWAMN
jgi:hypothetical protein